MWKKVLQWRNRATVQPCASLELGVYIAAVGSPKVGGALTGPAQGLKLRYVQGGVDIQQYTTEVLSDSRRDVKRTFTQARRYVVGGAQRLRDKYRPRRGESLIFLRAGARHASHLRAVPEGAAGRAVTGRSLAVSARARPGETRRGPARQAAKVPAAVGTVHTCWRVGAGRAALPQARARDYAPPPQGGSWETRRGARGGAVRWARCGGVARAMSPRRAAAEARVRRRGY